MKAVLVMLLALPALAGCVDAAYEPQFYHVWHRLGLARAAVEGYLDDRDVHSGDAFATPAASGQLVEDQRRGLAAAAGSLTDPPPAWLPAHLRLQDAARLLDGAFAHAAACLEGSEDGCAAWERAEPGAARAHAEAASLAPRGPG